MHKIMLLEDDASLIDGLEYTLKKNDFDVDVARSLKEARRLLKKTVYDLLLFDVTLPDGNGFALCEELRKGGNLVPVIFLTAADEEYSVIRGLDIGGDDYITNPFRLGELLSRIHALLRRSRRRAGNGRRRVRVPWNSGRRPTGLRTKIPGEPRQAALLPPTRWPSISGG